MTLFVIKFSFIEDKICEVFNGVFVYFLHEDFYVIFWDFSLVSW